MYIRLLFVEVLYLSIKDDNAKCILYQNFISIFIILSYNSFI